MPRALCIVCVSLRLKRSACCAVSQVACAVERYVACCPCLQWLEHDGKAEVGQLVAAGGLAAVLLGELSGGLAGEGPEREMLPVDQTQRCSWAWCRSTEGWHMQSELQNSPWRRRHLSPTMQLRGSGNRRKPVIRTLGLLLISRG